MATKKTTPKGKAKTPQENQAPVAGLGLDGLDLSGLLDTPTGGAKPLELPLDLIDEDSNQPRREDNPGFSEESLNELATTIRDRGVKTPISVRENGDRYIINHGARRKRAAIIAGLETIPAFIDNDYKEIDQIIENLQRNNLTAREIANFIGRELAKGEKKKNIAESLGKSSAYVTQHAALLDLPEPIAKAFNDGKASDVTLINDLVTLYEKYPEDVAQWIESEKEFTRGNFKMLRDFLDEKVRQDDGGGDDDELQGEKPEKSLKQKKDDPTKLKKAIVQVKHDGRMGRLLLNRRPSGEGWVWVKYEDGEEMDVEVDGVQIMALVEG